MVLNELVVFFSFFNSKKLWPLCHTIHQKFQKDYKPKDNNNNLLTENTGEYLHGLRVNKDTKSIKNRLNQASVVVQWLRIRLPMQGTRVWALVGEDPTCHRANKPVRHNYWARTPQLLKPERLEPVLHNKRSHCNEKPTHHNKEYPLLAAATTRESPRTATKTQGSQKKKKKKRIE